MPRPPAFNSASAPSWPTRPPSETACSMPWILASIQVQCLLNETVNRFGYVQLGPEELAAYGAGRATEEVSTAHFYTGCTSDALTGRSDGRPARESFAGSTGGTRTGATAWQFP